ncbi:glycogen debranching protein [Rhodovastum atsumiense]|uniref:Glycogen debranching protein n=2 Tax=Rhodovastum atsumiense TaxID=504468 RepID=A0A5M6J1U8_9PROT|nr:glycogen debranching protein [Rhodovastum atsumiense]
MDLQAEWLETDGHGGYASGTVSGERTRRYHALLLTATTPPTGRVVLVNGIEAWLEGPHGRIPLSTQRYLPDIRHPEGDRGIVSFSATPWPRWQFASRVTQEILAGRQGEGTVLRWCRTDAAAPTRLLVRPLLSGRDYHALHRHNDVFDATARVAGGNVGWRPYRDLPGIALLSNGQYEHDPQWFYNFLYHTEAARGLDCVEDLLSPGMISFDLSHADAVMVLRTGEDLSAPANAVAAALLAAEHDRRSAVPTVWLAADAYLTARDGGLSLIAGYPWFTDWGRDTFIAMRGLMLGTGRLAEAKQILLTWAGLVNQGMLPNRFPDAGTAPEYNAVDASLWFIIAMHDLLDSAAAAGEEPASATQACLIGAAEAILDGYARGTRYGIGVDQDGLLRAGEPGQQLTWMDARFGDWVVTPRIGKPVEVEALWINALRIAGAWSPRWQEMEARARTSFAARFPDPATGGLVDVVDVDHVPGHCDRSLRPNQILAVGGLPFPLLTGTAARRVVDLVEARLLTPLGLRTLSPDHPAYAPRYQGDLRARDAAYHQGTAWPWLMGPFVEAWLRVRGDTPEARQEARTRFLAPLRAHLDTAGLGHVSELADAEAPHAPGGCPFQAWSLGEVIRIERMLTPETRALLRPRSGDA